MKDELAERLLAAVMAWEPSQVAAVGSALQMLATHKYDRYGGYRPGERFLESLASWLRQFPSPADRQVAIDFVLQKLVFISSAELGHLIELVYPDVLRPRLLAQSAKELAQPNYRIATIGSGPVFRALQRRTLILGMSDGARLDLLRKACPELSHEQFWLTPELGREASARMVEQLDKALKHLGLSSAPRTFVEIVLVEDFSGSGMTLLRPSNDTEKWEGKLAKVQLQLERLVESGTVARDARVLVLIYIASSDAEDKVRSTLQKTGWGWDIHVIQQLPREIMIRDPYLLSMCESFFDPILEDDHKGRSPRGYNNCALPLVLEHNTPNNSICILWADTSMSSDSQLCRHALFPRYERHHKDRP